MRIERGCVYEPGNVVPISESAILTIEDSYVEIEITTEHIDPTEYSKKDILLGVFNGIGDVTLIECIQSYQQIGGGASVIRFRVKYTLKGIHLNSIDDLHFTRCYANIPSLVEWVNIKSINNKLFSQKTLQIVQPDDLYLTTIDDYKLLFSFGHQTKVSVKEIFLKQNTSLKIEAKSGNLTLRKFLEILHHFKKFLMVIANESPYLESITFYKKEHYLEQPDTLEPIELFAFYSIGDEFSKQKYGTPPIEFSMIQDNISTILEQWYTNKELKTSIDLISERMNNTKISRESYFLNTCFAIEIFHRRFYKNNIYERSEFKKIRKEIVKNITDNELKNIIDQKLAFANEPSFRMRLQEFINEFGAILSENMNLENYFKRIVNTRNYLVHRERNKDTFNEFEMYYAARYVESVVRICILKRLNFTEDVIEKIQKYTNQQLASMYNVNNKFRSQLPQIP